MEKSNNLTVELNNDQKIIEIFAKQEEYIAQMQSIATNSNQHNQEDLMKHYMNALQVFVKSQRIINGLAAVIEELSTILNIEAKNVNKKINTINDIEENKNDSSDDGKTKKKGGKKAAAKSKKKDDSSDSEEETKKKKTTKKTTKAKKKKQDSSDSDSSDSEEEKKAPKKKKTKKAESSSDSD